MDLQPIEPVTMSEILATWNRPRTTEQLLAFIKNRESAISSFDVEM